MLDLAIRGGTVVTPDASDIANVGVADGWIAAVTTGEVGAAKREIDATGMLVLPGCVDLHAHLASEPGWRPLDDFASGSRAAAAGGVTTVCAFAGQQEGEGLWPAIERAQADAAVSIVDYAYHVIVVDPSDAALRDVPELVAAGHAGLKVFMVMRQFAERTADYVRLLQVAAESGALTAIHAEDHRIVELRTRELLESGRTGVEWFPESRPPEAEELAVRAAIGYSDLTGAPIYLVHLSSRRVIEALRGAAAAGSAVYGETRPIYLYLTREVFSRADGGRFVGQPPLREQDDVDALWEALADGTLSTVGTDHVPHRRFDKLDPKRTFDKIPPGVANLETMLPMLYSEGVAKGRLTLRRMVEVLAAEPARLAGMTPRKGSIAVGADADLVVFDPNLRRTIRASETFSAADDDPFEGWEITGWPVVTISRGDVIYEAGKITAEPGRGRFVPRRRWAGSPLSA